ncbi:MAG: sulfotransferase domain-containing protein, partial [Alphaproteobacteria bacterium]|nr:sulfotransferase domain-containing protein [Alphaproteobacteria bacterium]
MTSLAERGGDADPGIQRRDLVRLWLHAQNRGWFNTTMLRRRRFDGAVCSLKNAGSHWVKYMLSLALAELHGLPAPEHIRSNAIVGHPKRPPAHSHIPQIVTSHSAAHHLLHWRPAGRLLRLPRYVVLVRDLRHLLVSYHEKWHDAGEVDFAAYLRGRATPKRFDGTIWEFIRFLNSWAPVIQQQPERAIVARYEDLERDTEAELVRIAAHLGIDGLTPELARRVAAMASREEMAKHPDPTENHHDKVVGLETRAALDWYDDADRRFLSRLL